MRSKSTGFWIFSLILLVFTAVIFSGCKGENEDNESISRIFSEKEELPSAVIAHNISRQALEEIPDNLAVLEEYTLEDLGPEAMAFAVSDFDGDGALELFVIFESGEKDPKNRNNYLLNKLIAIPVYTLYEMNGAGWKLSMASATTSFILYPMVWKKGYTWYEKNRDPVVYSHNLDGKLGDEILVGYKGLDYYGFLIVKILPDRILELGSVNYLEMIVEKSEKIPQTYLIRYEGASQFDIHPELGLFQKYSCYYINEADELVYIKNLPDTVFDAVYEVKKKNFSYSKKLTDFQFLFWFCYANNRSLLNDRWIKNMGSLVKLSYEGEKWTLRKFSNIFQKRIALEDKEFLDYLKSINFKWKF
ncbi:MAG: hypothetical protein JW969_11025 [Spirochaetales bacterium]|nr:hypothetical protein [Spirochaetales bacterium]